MSLKIAVTSDARRDYDDAHAHYRQARTGLAPRFRRAVNACMSALKKGALYHSIIYPPDVRHSLVKGFPFAVIYRRFSRRSAGHCDLSR